MKKYQNYTILSNKEISNNIYELIVEGDIGIVKPGEFVNVEIPGKYLMRPFSIADCNNVDKLNIVYRVVGDGTHILSLKRNGESLRILSGLGNGFDLEEKTKKPLLVGGGTGAAPIYYLAVNLKERGINPFILLGFKKENEAFYLEKFEKERFNYKEL